MTVRRRWFSARAIRLHAAVIVVAPGCALAGWWQATRALAGNGLSWFYSVEWPVFAALAIAGWWHLVHEDPEQLQARRGARHEAGATPAAAVGANQGATAPVPERITAGVRARSRVDPPAVRLAAALEVLVGLQLALGIAVLVLVPFHRRSGLLPPGGAAVFVTHASLGLPLAAAACAFFVRHHRQNRVMRAAASTGAAGVALAGAGGLLSLLASARFAGVALMLLGTILAGLGFAFPLLDHLELSDADASVPAGPAAQRPESLARE